MMISEASAPELTRQVSPRIAHKEQSPSLFKVLRDGCWKKVDFERPGVQLHKTNDSHSFVASPWIQHFRSGSKSSVLASASSKEVSDQNFVDEEKGERANNNNAVRRS